MARLVWGEVGQRFYETGVDRGVLYIDNAGYAWSGLASVNENPEGGDARPFYLDGVKYLNLASKEEYEATIEAFYSPPEFDACDGSVAIAPGLFATQQRRKSFGFSYRTKIGNDLDGSNHGYKIHMVYNALAKPASRSYVSISADPEAPLLGWDITTKPPSVPGASRSAHLVVDTTLAPPYSVEVLEKILYGDDDTIPRLPDPDELLVLFMDAAPIEVLDIGNGMFTVSGPDMAIQMIGEGTYSVRSHSVFIIDDTSAQLTSSDE